MSYSQSNALILKDWRKEEQSYGNGEWEVAYEYLRGIWPGQFEKVQPVIIYFYNAIYLK